MSTLIDDCLDSLSSTVQMNIDVRKTAWREKLSSRLRDDSMTELGESLAMDPTELEENAKRSVRKILQAIHDHSRCPIDRFCVSGSIGHQADSSLDAMGFDITVFVDCSVSHGAIETRESEHLECSAQSSEKIYGAIRSMISSTSCKCDHLGLHFELDGYQFHLGVTPSFGHKMHLQRKAVWDLIEAKDKSNELTQSDLDKFSLSLHESLTSFMHLGDPVLHGLVRLARLWRMNMLIEQGFGELSCLGAVLVMMRCIEDERAIGMSVTSPSGRGVGQHPFPVKKVFMDFLKCLSNLNTQTISYQRFYEPDLVPERHLSHKPYILDPVNPWRNVLHNMTPNGIESVSNLAINCLKLCESSHTTLNDLFIAQRGSRGG